jgi:hypothetical protein
VKKVLCDIGEQGKYGNKLYFCNGKKVGGFAMYLFNFELLKSLKLTFIDYLEIKIWKKL